MRHTLLSLFILLLSYHFTWGQSTYYSTGLGGDKQWFNSANWSSSPTENVAVDTPPGPNDNVIIGHEIFLKAFPGFVHEGDITIMADGRLEINSGNGLSDPFVFSGDVFDIQGTLITSSDLHNQKSFSDDSGLLIFGSEAFVEIGDDLILNGNSKTIMNNAGCTAGGAFDDVYFKGTSATLCGQGSFLVPDAIRAWNDNNQEIVPSFTQVANQICDGFEFFASMQDCQDENPITLDPTFPIVLSNFEASVAAQGVRFDWTTLMELNNDFFTIERSRDGDEYYPVATIEGAGTLNNAKSYTYTDRLAPAGKMFYRLKQTDYDGTTSYSSLVEINHIPQASFAQVYPNPANGSNAVLKVQGFPADKQVPVQILNINGQLVGQDKMEIDPYGDGAYTIPSQLSKGLYIAKVLSRKGWVATQFILH